MVKQMQSEVELLRDAFVQLMPPHADIRSVSVIRVFADEKEYLAYVPKELSWSTGLWVADKKELVIKAGDWGNRRESQQETMRTVAHEAFHQYFFYAMDRAMPAAWFNEGVAMFFENAALSEQRLKVEEDPYLTRILDPVVQKERFSLKELFAMGYPQFYDKDKDVRNVNYALAWGLAYYLIKGAPLEKPPKYGKVMQNYVSALWETKDGDRATAKAFEKEDIEELQRDLVRFWKSQSKRNSARRYDIFKAFDAEKKTR